jgi:K+-transporting ATPase ATPase C chain
MKGLFRCFFLLVLLTGVIYPLFMTLFSGLSSSVFLIGQSFQSERYFWSRPSACNYQTLPSVGSNLSPTSRALQEEVARRRTTLGARAPSDLLFSSGSGLDPHISIESALFQVERVAQARHLPPEELKALIEQLTEPRTFGFLGEERINVLKLNLQLDALP